MNDLDNIRTNSAGLRPSSKGIGGPLEGTKGGPLVPSSARKEAAEDWPEASSTAKGEEKPVDPSLGYMTTNEMAFGLRSMPDTAEVYERMLEATRPTPGDNLTFTSMWGDALKKGDLTLWKEQCLKSTQQQMNDEVHPPSAIQDNPSVKDARATFLKWMADNKKYFGQLLKPEVAEEARRHMKGLPVEQQEEFLKMMRDVHNNVLPDQAPFMSCTHATYGWPASYADPAIVAMEMAETRYRTYGRPRQVEVKGPKRSTTVPKEPRAPERRPSKAKASVLKDGPLSKPFESNFKLRWAGSDAIPPQSAYSAQFAPHPVKAYANKTEPIKTVNPYVQPTAAFGPLNAMAFPEIADKGPRPYLVPKYYTQRTADRPTKDTKAAPETTYENCFKEPLGGDDLVKGKAMQKERRDALRKSTIPLGKGGVMYEDSGQSVYRGFFVEKPMDLKWRQERAEVMRAQVNAPTVSVGRMAPIVESRDEREARQGITRRPRPTLVAASGAL